MLFELVTAWLTQQFLFLTTILCYPHSVHFCLSSDAEFPVIDAENRFKKYEYLGD